MSALPATIPAPEPSNVQDPPGFWQILGENIAAGARAIGGGFQSAFYAVDPDARRDIAQMPLLALTVLGPRYGAVQALPDDGHRPIVFVHGLGGHRGNFLPMRAWLGVKGRRRGYSIGLPWGEDLVEMGRVLARFIEDVCEVNGLPDDAQVDVVAHSMGGVVARLALVDLACARRVRTLVTLGTPHAGTQAARFAGTPTCRSLRPGSDVMQRLAEQTPWQSPSRLVCFWSPSDPLMQPSETARVEGADNRELEGFSHNNYLLRREGFAAVLEALEG